MDTEDAIMILTFIKSDLDDTFKRVKIREETEDYDTTLRVGYSERLALEFAINVLKNLNLESSPEVAVTKAAST